jgi:hypothetical protein
MTQETKNQTQNVLTKHGLAGMEKQFKKKTKKIKLNFWFRPILSENLEFDFGSQPF